MKIIIFSIIILFACRMEAQNKFENPILKEQIKKLDLAHAQAIFDGNAIALDSLMSDNVTVNVERVEIILTIKTLSNENEVQNIR